MDVNDPIAVPDAHPTNWAQHYSLLSLEERKDPMGSITGLCDIQHLFDTRLEIWNMLTAVMGSNVLEDDTPSRRADRVFFFEKTLELWELAHRLYELVEGQKLVYSYHYE